MCLRYGESASEGYLSEVAADRREDGRRIHFIMVIQSDGRPSVVFWEAEPSIFPSMEE